MRSIDLKARKRDIYSFLESCEQEGVDGQLKGEEREDKVVPSHSHHLVFS